MELHTQCSGGMGLCHNEYIMPFTTIVTLLNTALLLLQLAQGPNVPQALRDQAVGVANRAITEATLALSSTSSSTKESVISNTSVVNSPEVSVLENSCPYYIAPDCMGGTLVTNGTDPNGCFLGYRCVVSATTTPEVCASGSCQSPSADIPPLSCTLSSVTIRSGQSYAFYSMPFAANCADVSQVRTCADGKLSGESQYQFSICL